MGYQNNERPKGRVKLLVDALCDLSDLKEDIRNGVSKEDIMARIDWIKETIDMVVNKL